MRSVKMNFNGKKYEVYEDGMIISERGKVLSQRLTEDGYKRVTIGDSQHRTAIGVHRLVALAFVEGRTLERNEVNHIDRNRTNNHFSNLEWCTHEENIRYSMENIIKAQKKKMKGEGNIKAIQTEETVKEMRDLYDNKIYTIKEISDIYSSKWSTVNNIVKRLTWKHI